MLPLSLMTDANCSPDRNEPPANDSEQAILRRSASASNFTARRRIDTLIREAVARGESGARLRLASDENSAEHELRKALVLACEAVTLWEEHPDLWFGLDDLSLCARLALEHGEPALARRVARRVFDTQERSAPGEEWLKIVDTGAWTDAWLIAAIRSVTPDKEALNELAQRYWPKLFGRCCLLAVNRENALDLAQEAWFRVLKYRHALKPNGNFSAYIAMVATSLWRDRYRFNQRIGALGEKAILSLDSAPGGEAGELRALWEVVPDVASLEAAQELELEQHIDSALAALPPILRAVLVARFIEGESCATIGRRFRRTEQTISGWVRRGLQEMRDHLKNR